jgi:hypothetical protein
LITLLFGWKGACDPDRHPAPYFTVLFGVVVESFQVL